MRLRVLDLACRRPLTLAAAVTVLWHLLLFAVEDLLPPLRPGWFPDLGAAVVNVVLAALTLALIGWLGWWRETGLAWRRPDRSWWLLLPLLAEGLLHLVDGLTGSATALASAAVTMLAVGLAEESLSRGLVQRLLSPLGLARAAVLVGVLFGLGHAMSGLWFGRPGDEIAFQVVNTAAFGFCLAALRWHVRTIWPLVGLHALVNFTSINSPGALPDVVQIGIIVALIAYGWWLLRLLDRRPERTPDPARTG
ncbi:CPBP family intramembrane metalloprotease [Modestobacter sp. VKM Ac-2979]|uniref:CPBP family intramembrane glutamic endopeptidase n=1 Tax=unclassified Modestobacter TaxID=2643866 RepID=UPI0022AB7056|nr:MULTISPECIES: CPBP family intramembrane glutamic endopeptidase [unclassified Modestobacter]MCZ2810291.1 CPBP family intramembrane metalloprotease [Modestobacter sp. VKM Ac-2979]MCZ2841777.1 CPBP family intramembrane metalloprotease [Modestobacter sp. VKM Ac-2980]